MLDLLRTFGQAVAFVFVFYIHQAYAEDRPARQAAPQNLESKHDYTTVDISTLDGWEQTYVPDARKKPIFDIILGMKWKLKEGVDQAPYCTELHQRLTAWEDVELVEPTFRTNSYGDPLFSNWHEKCPKMKPHMSEGASKTASATYYGSNHFKVFELPPVTGGEQQAILYFQGNAPFTFMDAFGNLLRGDSYQPMSSGRYRVIDLNSCRIKHVLQNMPASAFAYYFGSAKSPYAESAVFRIGGEYFVVGSSPPIITDFGFLNYHKISTFSEYLEKPDCIFFPADE